MKNFHTRRCENGIALRHHNKTPAATSMRTRETVEEQTSCDCDGDCQCKSDPAIAAMMAGAFYGCASAFGQHSMDAAKDRLRRQTRAENYESIDAIYERSGRSVKVNADDVAVRSMIPPTTGDYFRDRRRNSK